MLSHNYAGTAKRPARILKMARNTDRYRWRSRDTSEYAQVIELRATRKAFKWFVIVEHESGRKFMYPPRVFWLEYIKEDNENNICGRDADYDR